MESSLYTPILAARFGNFCVDSLFTDQQKYNRINLEVLPLMLLALPSKWPCMSVFSLLLPGKVSNNSKKNFDSICWSSSWVINQGIGLSLAFSCTPPALAWI